MPDRAIDLTPTVPGGRQLIQGYDAGGFRIAGIRHPGSVLVLPEQTLGWPVGALEEVTAGSLAPIVIARPPVEILVLGLGPRFVIVPAGLRAALKDAGIALEAMATGAACRTYNVLLTEGRRVAAALIAL